VKDDLSDCVKEKRVFFSYKPVTYASTDVIREGIDPADITRMNLYIFDENGLFVEEIIDESPVMSPDYYMTIPHLKSGKYTFVAWGNLQNQYTVSSDMLIPGKTSVKELQVYLNRIANKVVNEPLTPLFYAAHTGENLEVVSAAENQKFQLNIVQDTHTINVSVAGVGFEEEKLNNNTYRLEIYDNNDKFGFDNNFVQSDFFTYSSPCTKEQASETLTSSLTVMRLADDRKPKLRIVNDQTGDCLLEEDLVALFLALRDLGVTIDFSYQHEFTIRYIFDATTLTVYVNGWKLVREYGELEF
jgi:hypothetical protein